MSYVHCRQRAPVGNALSSSGTSQLGMFDIQATTKSKYYDHIVLLYLESRRCRYGSIIFACFYSLFLPIYYCSYQGRIQDLGLGGGVSRRGIWGPLKVPSGSRAEP